MARHGMLLHTVGFAAMLALITAATAPDPTAISTCADADLTPERTEGPFYLDDEISRANVTEGQGGVPLTLQILVVDADCRPIADAYVDLWHANATGEYSGFTGVNNDNTTFMRGVVQTALDGVGTFYTVYPGWYPGRTPHIHLKVHVPYNASQSTDEEEEEEEFENSHVVHTGQLFFEDDLSTEVYQLQPYATRTGNFLPLAYDNIYMNGGNSTVVAITQVDAASLATGLMGIVTIKVNSNTTPASASAGGMAGQRPVPSGGMGPMPNGMGPMPSGGAADAVSFTGRRRLR